MIDSAHGSTRRRRRPRAAPNRVRLSRRCAFTLIELLTVISIITLLISLLLPSLVNARKRGRITKCQSNLRELARATLTYTQQNRDFFPLVKDCVGNTCLFWNGHQYFGWDGQIQNSHGRPWVRAVNSELALPLTGGEPGSAKIAQCPDDEGAVGQVGRSGALYELLGTSYPINPILVQGAYAEWKYRSADLTLSQVLQAARTVLVFDHPAFGLTYDGIWTGIRPGWHDQRQPAAAVAFIDGHADYLTGRCTLHESQWYAEATGPEFVRQLRQKVNWSVLPGCE
ncbi:MAG: prepilin-type N-terminal cleavage/methylation domain-containing protein [Phycisphaerae bacterium]|nr:prepilin-type N-terminal cleavage/methylation domain-containing protein [Phycisphaerae bacterium]